MTSVISDEHWDKELLARAPAHYMQSEAWAESKSGSPWHVFRFAMPSKLPVQVLARIAPLLGEVQYAPQVAGITADDVATLTQQIRTENQRGMLFKLELYQAYDEALIEAFKRAGWRRTGRRQPEYSVLVDLTGSLDEVSARFKKRARWEIRVAERAGVKVERAELTKENFDTFRRLLVETEKRSGAFFRSREYMDAYWNAFNARGQGRLYFARLGDELLSGAYVIEYDKTAWYKDGGSVRDTNNVYGSRFMQWEIIKDLHAAGVTCYDLSGISPPNDKNHANMAGIYTFKTAFARDITRFMPAFDLPLSSRARLWPKLEKQYIRANSQLHHDFWY